MACMTSEEANKLQLQWGNKPCTHPGFVAASEDKEKFRCVRCGQFVDISEWSKAKQNRD